jgi:hypothetical protein
VLQVGAGTVVIVVEGKYRPEVLIEVEVQAEKISMTDVETTQSVEARVIATATGPGWYGPPDTYGSEPK